MQREQQRNKGFRNPKKMDSDFRIKYCHSSYFQAWANKSKRYSPGTPDSNDIYDLVNSNAITPNTYVPALTDYYGKLFAMLVTVPVYEHARWRNNFYTCFSGAYTADPKDETGIYVKGHDADKMCRDHMAANVICIANVLNRASRRDPHTCSEQCPFSTSDFKCMQVVWSLVYQRYLQTYLDSLVEKGEYIKYHRLSYGKDKIEEAGQSYIYPANLSCTNAHSINYGDAAIYNEAADRIIAASKKYMEKFIHMVNIGETNINRMDSNYPSYSKNEDYLAHIHFLVIGSITNVNDRMILPIEPNKLVKTDIYDQFRIKQKNQAFDNDLRNPSYYGNVYHYEITFPYEKKKPSIQLTSSLLEGRNTLPESMSVVHEQVDRHKHPEERNTSLTEYNFSVRKSNSKRTMDEIARFTSIVTSNATTPFSEFNYKNKKSAASKAKYTSNTLEESIPLVTNNRQFVISKIKDMILGKDAETNPLAYFSTQHHNIVEKILREYDANVAESLVDSNKAFKELHDEAMRIPAMAQGITFEEHLHQLGINGHIHAKYTSPNKYVHPILGEYGVKNIINFAQTMNLNRVPTRDFFFDYNDVYFDFGNAQITLAMIISKNANIVRNKHYINGLLALFIIDLCTKWPDHGYLIDRFTFVDSALRSHMERIVEVYERKIAGDVISLIDSVYQALEDRNHRDAYNITSEIMSRLETVTKYHKLA